MSLIYNALQEQDVTAEDGISKAADEEGSPPYIGRQTRGLFSLRVLIIIGGLVGSSLLAGYYLWHLKGTDSSPVTGQSVPGPLLARRPASNGPINKSAASMLEGKSNAGALVEGSKRRGGGVHTTQQEAPGLTSVKRPFPQKTVPRQQEFKVPAVRKKVIAVSGPTVIPVQTPALALSGRMAKKSIAADKVTASNVVKKRILPHKSLRKSISGGGSVSLPAVPKTVTTNSTAPAKVWHEPAAKFRSTRNFLREIGELVAQIKVSMRGKDTARTKSLLRDLERRAGGGSVIVLRMRGYWLLQQHKNALAQKAYQQLLIQQPDDMAANLNMALLELRAGDHKQALARMTRMAAVYPDSGRVHNFMRLVRNAGGR